MRLLERARNLDPADRDILADLIIALSWAGRDREALARFATLGEADVPAYVLAAAAVSARRSGQASRAVHLYRLALSRGDDSLETHLGLAIAEAARGDAAAARIAVGQAEAIAPGNPRVQEVAQAVDRVLQPNPAVVADRIRAAARTQGAERAAADAVAASRGASPATAAALSDTLMELGRPFDALAVLEGALRASRDDRALRRREALALASVGAPELALIRGHGVLDAAEERRIRNAANAFLVRWGAQIAAPHPRDPDSRYARTDAALAATDAAIAAWTPLGSEAAAAVRNARLDRVVALRGRDRMAEALAEADALREGGALPSYVREVVGDALMNQRRPEEALEEYRAVVAADPAALNPSLGLFYALAELRQWREARQVAERLERETPAFRTLRGPEPPAEEWARIDAVRAGILWRMWGDDLAGAEAEADPLAAAAPMNSSLRALRGDIWRMRGWPEQALEEYETALTNDPNALDLRLGRAEALLERRRWADARAEIEMLSREYPANAAVRRLVRRLEIHDMRLFEAEVTSGLQRGDQDPELDVRTRLWSAPIAEDWRAFGGFNLRTGNTVNGHLTTYRAAAGAQWRVPEAVVTGGVTFDMEGVDRGGAFLNANIRLNDQWTLDGTGEITAADTPLAALRAGIYADAAGVGITWRQSDLREVAASFRVMEFSDDNTRLIGFARWQERVMNLPDWKLDLQPYAYATSNTRDNAPYYNPERDLEVAATGALTWIAWRRYERDLRVRFIATGGGYWQENYGWSPLIALRWENQHNLTDTIALSYGAGWVRRDYDGRSEDSASVTAALRWRF